jgi:hypothetical protein
LHGAMHALGRSFVNLSGTWTSLGNVERQLGYLPLGHFAARYPGETKPIQSRTCQCLAYGTPPGVKSAQWMLPMSPCFHCQSLQRLQACMLHSHMGLVYQGHNIGYSWLVKSTRTTSASPIHTASQCQKRQYALNLTAVPLAKYGGYVLS